MTENISTSVCRAKRRPYQQVLLMAALPPRSCFGMIRTAFFYFLYIFFISLFLYPSCLGHMVGIMLSSCLLSECVDYSMCGSCSKLCNTIEDDVRSGKSAG